MGCVGLRGRGTRSTAQWQSTAGARERRQQSEERGEQLGRDAGGVTLRLSSDASMSSQIHSLNYLVPQDFGQYCSPVPVPVPAGAPASAR